MRHWERISVLSRKRGIVCWRNRDGAIRTVGRYSGGSPDRRGTVSNRCIRVRTGAYAFAARLHKSGRFVVDCW
jgi:hypothetical protein